MSCHPHASCEGLEGEGRGWCLSRSRRCRTTSKDGVLPATVFPANSSIWCDKNSAMLLHAVCVAPPCFFSFLVSMLPLPCGSTNMSFAFYLRAAVCAIFKERQSGESVRVELHSRSRPQSPPLAAQCGVWQGGRAVSICHGASGR